MTYIGYVDGEMPGERTPLIPPAQPDASDRKTLIRTARTLRIILAATVAVAGVADAFVQPAWTRILESIVCYRYYEIHDPSMITGRPGPGAIGGVDERFCKLNAIQDELARNQGWQTFFDSVPALFLSIPLGWAADQYGRKPVIVLGFFACILRQAWLGVLMWFWQLCPNLDILWTSSLSFILGGGNAVTAAVLFTVQSDVTPSAERASVFFMFGAVNLLPYTFANPLGGVLMALNPWIPYLASTLLLVPCLMMVAIIPETLDWRVNSSSNPPSPPLEATPSAPSLNRSISALSTSAHLIDTLFVRTKNAARFLTSDWRVPLLCVLFTAHTAFGTCTTIFLRCSTKRYSIAMWVSTMLLSIFYAIKVILLLLIFPQLTKLIRNTFNLSESTKDLHLSRISFVLLTIGWLLVGLAPTLPLLCIALAIAAAGTWPAYLALRSFLTGLVPAHHIARVYTCIGLFDTLGSMFGAPLMARLLSAGNDLGGAWIGMPFFVLGCRFTDHSHHFPAARAAKSNSPSRRTTASVGGGMTVAEPQRRTICILDGSCTTNHTYYKVTSSDVGQF